MATRHEALECAVLYARAGIIPSGKTLEEMEKALKPRAKRKKPEEDKCKGK